MASEGMQITIPDFDDSDYPSATTSFGKAAAGNGHAFGHGFGSGFASAGFGSAGFGSAGFPSASGSGQDSPTISTPTAVFDRSDKSYFTAHTRGDSNTSVDSASSVATRYTTKTNPFSLHTSQPSTSTSPFTKKPSFASIRNAFKSGKASDAPPVPQIDHQAYPVLKNPFNRSNTSVNITPTLSSRSTVSTNISPPSARPQTPLNETKFGRSISYKSRGHTYAKSNHSQTGSIFQTPDAVGDFGSGPLFSSSPPPVPRVPNAFGHASRSQTPDFEDDKVVMDPKTPSDYALHAVFMRFASSAELKINGFLQQNIDSDPSLLDSMGPGVDAKFDETLLSLGKIAQKQSKAVVDSIMRWRRSQLEAVSSSVISLHVSQANGQTRSARAYEIPSLLNERKSLASIYIMCRALLSILKSISKDALGEALGYSLEETTFEQFRRPDLKLLSQSANHRVNAELYATVLGYLANIRFESVTDRFLAELAPLASGQVPKDLDMKYEYLVKGLKHVTIKVWPPETFEEGAEFLESLAKSFANAHGLRLKTAFAEALLHLLHPIGKTAQAETNNPEWAKAIEVIFPKAREMVSKPRYWQVAYPLMVTSLCVAPQAFFLKHWFACFESGVSKLKEKLYRVPILNAMIRLIWTYLYRCQESASTTTAKLDTVLKHFFPSNRLSVYPAEDVQPFVLIMHFILSRHFEYGRDICLELMQESAVNAAQHSGNLISILSPEKTAIAIQAILLSLHGIERDETVPAWPSSIDFSTIPSWDDYPTSSEFVSPSLAAKPGVQDLLDRCCTTLGIIAVACGNAVANMSVLDEQWSYAKINPAYEESHNYVVRKHGDLAVAYPTQLVPQISMLQFCFQAWPRCLHASVTLADAVDLLFRGVIHVEPLLADVACEAIKRFMADPQQAVAVLSRFTSFLFGPSSISREGTGPRILVEASQLLDLWVAVVESWIRKLTQSSKTSLSEEEISLCGDLEAGALFLLAQEKWSIHAAGVRIIRLLGLWVQHVAPGPMVVSDPPATSMHFVELLHGRGEEKPYLHGYDELLEKLELLRLEQWRQSKRIDVPLRLADSNNEKDRKLWRHVYPSLLQHAMNSPGCSNVLMNFRESLIAAVSKYLPFMSHLAGLSSRVPPGMPTRSTQGVERDGLRLVRENKPLVEQWYIWIKVLCSTATLSETSRPALTQLAGRDHSRAPSDASFERERLSTTRGLFRYLTPFLDSEYPQFRDAAVLCISAFPPSGYPQLLEDLSLLAGRQFYDDQRSKPPSSHGERLDDQRLKPNLLLSVERTRRQERLHSAVARIYYLTSHYLQHTRAAGRHAALSNVLKFVRNTQAFLLSPEMRDNPSLQRLRRYFCGTVERLFDGLASLKDSDRFIPPNMHLTLYRLCEEWCELGPQSDSTKHRLILMQRAAASASQDGSDTAERFQLETTILANAAVGALASLCQKAYYPPELASNSPTERSSPEYLKPLTPSAVMDRLIAILGVSHQPTVARGKKALKSLLALNSSDINLVEESLKRAVMVGDTLDSCSGCFFQVIADIVCNSDSHPFTFAQVVFVGLSNLSHPLLEVRRAAFNMLEAIHQQASGLLSMSQFEPMVGSQAPPTYTYAQRLISDFLAGEHPSVALDVLAQVATSLPKSKPRNPLAVLLLLQSLEFWMPNIDLQSKDGPEAVSREGSSALYHLMVITLQYSPSHTEQVLMLWTKLVEPPHERNSHFSVLFLLQQSVKVGTIDFVKCSAAIIACLCQTSLGRKIFSELCSLIDPLRMLPQHEHKLVFPDAEDMEIWSDLGALFADQPRISLGMAQYSWLFLADVALQRQWEFQAELPVLLQAVFTHVDHRIPFVREQARRMFFQLLRGWMPGYDELPDRTAHPTRGSLKTTISILEKETSFWKDDDPSTETEPKIKRLCSSVLELLEPLAPNLAERWASLALTWGTSCSIRSTALRSLQIFRAAVPYASKTDIAQLLGRLSNTISSSDDKMQPFSVEIIVTLQALTSSANLDRDLLPQLFWCASASLSTTDQPEFSQALQLFEAVLEQVNLDSDTEPLLSHQPPRWRDGASLQRSLLTGLRSSATFMATFKLLQRLSKVDDDRLIDASGGRVRDLYTVCLPWCLHAMATESATDSLKEFAENVARLAKREGKNNIHKILTSFAKGHFRTKDDFLRQSVSCLRDYFGADQWPQIDTLLLGFLLNNERWLRIYTMQILKVLFQQRVSRNPSERLSSELIMPLLRLLETDLAANALDVLEEPLTISGGGSAAKHVLRMSMHAPIHSRLGPVAEVFGVPDETGWCVAQADSLRDICRHNMMAVFDTCSVPSRPSLIDFEPELKFETPIPMSNDEEDLGGLVQNLHELTTFFQDEESVYKVHTPLPMPDHRLEARVAAILAKSTAADTVTDVPQTPFLDVFRVSSQANHEDSSDYSDSDSDDDDNPFIFDSPTFFRTVSQSSGYH